MIIVSVEFRFDTAEKADWSWSVLSFVRSWRTSNEWSWYQYRMAASQDECKCPSGFLAQGGPDGSCRCDPTQGPFLALPIWGFFLCLCVWNEKKIKNDRGWHGEGGLDPPLPPFVSPTIKIYMRFCLVALHHVTYHKCRLLPSCKRSYELRLMSRGVMEPIEGGPCMCPESNTPGTFKSGFCYCSGSLPA